MNVKLDVQLLDVVLHVRVDLQVCVRIMMISKLRKSMDLFDSFWVRIVSDLRPIDVRGVRARSARISFS
jgi:chorismate mutase